MKIPEGMTEKQVIATITKIAKILSCGRHFDIFDKEDIFQQAFIEGIKGLENFDPEKGKLEHFLASHIKRRLINFKRDNYVQPVNPEKMTHEQAENKMDMMFKKLAVYQAIDIDNVDWDGESSMAQEDDFEHKLLIKEIIEIIDNNLPLAYREDYTKLLNEKSISKTRKDRVFCKIVEILDKHGYTASKKNEWL